MHNLSKVNPVDVATTAGAASFSPLANEFPRSKIAAQILSIISTKGGEGKSTQGAYLAGFTADAGLKTLLIDGDYSQPTSCSIYHLDYEAPCGLYELLTQTVDLNSPDKIISRTCIPNLDVIVSNDPDERLPARYYTLRMAACVCAMCCSIRYFACMTSSLLIQKGLPEL